VKERIPSLTRVQYC